MTGTVPASGSTAGVTTHYVGNPNVTTAAGAVGYADHGAILTLPRGDTITEAWDYNTRLQPISITVGSAFSALLWYCDGFAATCTDNNGNIKGIMIGSLGNVNQSHSYDHLNRLTGASEGSAWSRGFNYDNSGNQWVTPQAGLLPFTPTASNSFNANNQLIDPATPAATNTFRYDASGNQTNAGSYVFKWDSEGRPVSSSINGSTVSYQYDGDGRRVMKQIDTAAPTVYIYDAMGELAAEIGAPVMSGCTTCYLSVDHLGSTRAVTDSAGSVVERHDYLPFGEELYSGTGTRSAALKYIASTGSSGLTDKFTGKERDAETGLDFFNVRYLSSAQGRFTSPDPLVWQSWQNGNDEERAKFQEFIGDPQNFNLYTYGRNNPLKYNDPTGLDVEVAITFVGDVSDAEKKRIIGAVQTYLEDKKVGKVVVRDAADASQDKRTFGQKLKDVFTTDFHSITVDFAHPNFFGNNADRPDFVKAANMRQSGEDNFGDLRTSDPQQWSNVVAWRVLHETISHAFRIGPDTDQLVTIKPGDARYGTLIQGAYGRGRPGIPGLNPADTQSL